MKEEWDQLKDIDSFVIIEYIKSSIEILLSLKLEEQEKEIKAKGAFKPQKSINNFKSNTSSIADFFSDQSSCRIDPPTEYENQLQKLEGDIRMHIRVKI